jgi:hypothetical protein
VVGFVLVRRLIAERLVEASVNANRFDVLEHAQSGGLQVVERFVVRSFEFERPEEAFRHRTVVVVAGTTHHPRVVHDHPIWLKRIRISRRNPIASQTRSDVRERV